MLSPAVGLTQPLVTTRLYKNFTIYPTSVVALSRHIQADLRRHIERPRQTLCASISLTFLWKLVQTWSRLRLLLLLMLFLYLESLASLALAEPLTSPWLWWWRCHEVKERKKQADDQVTKTQSKRMWSWSRAYKGVCCSRGDRSKECKWNYDLERGEWMINQCWCWSQ